MKPFLSIGWTVLYAIFATLAVVRAQESDNAGNGNLAYIDPRIGNVSILLVPTRPTAQLPHQVIRMYPMRDDYISDQISSFPLTIVSHRLGEVFSIKPSLRPVTPEAWGRPMTFDHDLEVTRPWYYSTYLLDDDVTVEFVPGKKAAIYRFTFPAKGPQSLLFGAYEDGAASWSFPSATEITGRETYHGNIPVYFYGRFSEKGAVGTATAQAVSSSTSIDAKKSRAWIRFPGTGARTVEFRYAVSFIGADQARKNFDEELDKAGFDDIRKAGMAAWAKVTDQIQVEGGTEGQRRSFYTALYRCNERMVDITEDGKYYSGFDNSGGGAGKIHDIAESGNRPFYVDDWIWDTYQALHPLRAILDPAMESDMLNSYVTMYGQLGWMPTFPVLFGDHACMNGFHSTITLLDAYRKGLRGFDAKKAYEGMLKNANEATILPWENGPKGPLTDFYLAHGYLPALHKGEAETVSEVHPRERRQAVAVTLGGSYDDWAVGQMAEELGDKANAQAFALRGKNYRNVWNPEKGMFYPKDAAGAWIDIDPRFDGGKGGRDYYDENNGWTYLWQVQYDLPGLIGLMGGKDKFQDKLDELFHQPLGRSRDAFWYDFPDSTGMVGQFSMGNEPSFPIPYLYNVAGAPWKTQARVRQLLDLWFKDTITGIPGDEDGGGMSSFVVFTSMGFYPLTPGIPLYTIGSPVFSKVSIALPNGKAFTLTAHNCSVVNKYIQSATLNGKTLDTPWFTHQQLVDGANIVLEMGPKPNKSWGLGPIPSWR